MLVIFRTRNEDWPRFKATLQKHEGEIRALGCTRIEAYRNRKHPEELVMLQDWPDKQTFDRFAAQRGPELDREAGVRWTDVSTWLESALP
jgi:quinol monooxygenase YgiN